MPDRSSWFILTLFIVAFTLLGALSSYADSYISTLNEKKLKKDEENDVKFTSQFEKLFDKKQKIIASLSFVKVFAGIAYGITVSVMFYRHLANVFFYLFGKPFQSGIAMAGIHLLSASCIVLIAVVFFYFLAVVLPDRLGFRRAHKQNGAYNVFPLVNFISNFDIVISAPFRGFSSLFFKDENIEGYITEDEVLSLVDLGEENGGIETAEKEMIENVFDFSDIKAGDVMTHRTSVVAIDTEMSEDEILSLINENEYSRYPVYKDDIDNIIGILSSNRFYANIISKDNKLPLKELLYKPYLVPESIHADTLLNEMRRRKNHIAIVVDEYGGTCGIVTMEDLLEKIVGNIYDETDDPASEMEIIPVGDGVWKIAGSADLDMVCDELGVDIDENEDFDTLGGLVFSCLTVIPTDGTMPVVDVFGLHIEVVSMNERRIEWALVSKLPEEKEENPQD